jgi:hypothetical protein
VPSANNSGPLSITQRFRRGFVGASVTVDAAIVRSAGTAVVVSVVVSAACACAAACVCAAVIVSAACACSAAVVSAACACAVVVSAACACAAVIVSAVCTCAAAVVCDCCRRRRKRRAGAGSSASSYYDIRRLYWLSQPQTLTFQQTLVRFFIFNTRLERNLRRSVIRPVFCFDHGMFPK